MAADSSSVVVTVPSSQTTPTNPTRPPAPSSSNFTIDKTLTSTANLVKLLPSCTVLIFQALSPIFTNHGTCRTSNKILAGFLIVISAFLCFLLSFFDSFTGPDGKLYYGIATFKGLYIISNIGAADQDSSSSTSNNISDVRALTENLTKFKVRFVDGVHGFLSSLLFISIAFTDSNIETCLFPPGSLPEMEQLFMSLTIGVGLLCVFAFMVFPSNRKGIGYSDLSAKS